MADKQAPLTVTALTKYLKLKFDVDKNLKDVLLKGEISNFRRQRNGHFYFSLKDEGAQISATMWARATGKVVFEPKDGMQVIVKGKLSIYEPTGTYSIQITRMTEDGVGNLYVAFNQLKEKLEKAGLFAPERKKVLPRMPRTVGLITSATGAAVRDMITTLKRRNPHIEILLYPAVVQGDAAALDIAKKIAQVNAEARIDVLIVGRGGGSIEDLWAFNEEVVAQAIFDSDIPVVSAVGHETDTTIADFVADMRAPTPTAAAELVAPNLADVIDYLSGLNARLNGGIRQQVNFKRLALTKLSDHYILRNPRVLFETKMTQFAQFEQKLDDLILARVHDRKQILQRSDDDLVRVVDTNLKNVKQTYALMLTKLEMLNPLAVLKKGYAVVTDEAGNAITDAKKLAAGDQIAVRLDAGQVKAEVKEVVG